MFPLQESIKVLGVTVDCGLRFDRHVAAVAHQASLRVSTLRRMAEALTPGASLNTALYGVQCPVLDVECCHSSAETGRRTAPCPAAGGDERTAVAAGGADRSHVVGASAGRVCSCGSTQGPSVGVTSPQLTKAPNISCPEGVQDNHL
ncbi:hypothetical protein E2C01_018777 [Portunus trituberculatus]|uniref:Uncharacterized protein n=1 Tax=Portunus trituberculatus TaxID=210409 RepID=A0A5B7DWK6_PORTR|nr:hypothetical protein [Portunus trituberculatus]